MSWRITFTRFALGVAVLGLSTGCQSTPEASPISKDKPDQPEVSSASAGLERVERRPRAALEGETPERALRMPIRTSKEPRAAEFIRVREAAEAPPIRADEATRRATSCLSFIQTTWLKAVNQDDPATYVDLLDARFKAFEQNSDTQPTVITREDWPAKRSPPIGSTTVIGPAELLFLPDPENKANLDLIERSTGSEGCVVNQRSMVLVQSVDAQNEPTGQWTIRRESITATRPCGALDEAQVLSSHRRLISAWKMQDRASMTELASGEFVHYDHGLEVNRYDLETLVNGDGRWVLRTLSKARTAEDDVTVFADLAIIRLTADLRVKYRRQANQWRLVALYRSGHTISQ